MSGYIDLHCHWVAGIDDGARTTDDSLEMLRALKDLGYAQVLATPHMRTGMFDNDKAELEEAYRATMAVVAEAGGLPAGGLSSDRCSAARVFDAIGIQAIVATTSDCCGALSHHLGAEEAALQQIRHNIDSWLAVLEQHDIEAITMTASGCGVMITDYLHLLADDAEYAEKARSISEAYRDPIEIIAADGDRAIEQLKSALTTDSRKPSVAFHPPCTLQHGHKISGQVEALLSALGYTLKPFADSHLCCGSAGTYSITQKHLSRKLLHDKISSIEAADTDMIITANIGCQTHLQSATAKPVRHWLELLA